MRTVLKQHKDVWQVKEQAHLPITLLLGSQAKAGQMEIKLCSFIAEKKILSIAEDLLPLLKDLFPSDEALHQVTSGKQKATNVICQVLRFYSIQECVAKLRANKFSLIIDETTNQSTTLQHSESTLMKRILDLRLS